MYCFFSPGQDIISALENCPDITSGDDDPVEFGFKKLQQITFDSAKILTHLRQSAQPVEHAWCDAWDRVLKRLSTGPTCAKARVSHVTHHAKSGRSRMC
ncbi:hypothetical protein Y032_1005g3367 [Ancylostoma ceylanicum]|uniref:Uncharacterized protein n=1 Tax=Ancylostoma ceylanicum TaxID=53326 RepID=A0A016W9H9_9BILA|nr:hypothetical protein Y032_1005g3367 [Ancylostoma ceylanicum]